MNQSDQQRPINNSGEIAFEEIFVKVKSATKYIKSKWLAILIVSILGGILGLGYSILKKPTYTAVCTFVLEESKGGGGLGQYSGLASLAGINVGGNGGGIFEGDNILELYKSRIMIEKALLSTCNFDGKKQLLIDRYIDYYRFRDKWKDNNKLSNISFNGDPDSFNRNQDSIITSLVELFNKNILDVSKPDKKLSIIYVKVTSKDELFSKFFAEKMVQNVNDFYIQTKTKKTYQNVQILQRQADSVKAILNSSISGVASAIDAAPNANPQMSTLKVTSQKKQVDVQANTAIYSEIIKNLEIEKIDLRQETPLIQVVDKPVLPLKVTKVGKLFAIVLGAIVSVIVIIGFLLIKKLLTSVFK